MFKRYKIEMRLVKKNEDSTETQASNEDLDKLYGMTQELLWMSFQGTAVLILIAGATTIAIRKFS